MLLQLCIVQLARDMKVDVKIRNDTDTLGVLSIVGPKAGQLLSRLTDSKVGFIPGHPLCSLV